MGDFWASKRKPLRVHLLVIFLTGLFLSSGLLIAINTVMGRDAALLVANQHMETAGKGIIERTYRLFREIQTFIRTASSSRVLSLHPSATGHGAMSMLSEALSHIPEVDGIFVGYPNGAFFHLVDLRHSPIWQTRLQSPPEATFAMRSIVVGRDGSRQSQWNFYNHDVVLIRSAGVENADYDPRVRPWYKAALETDEIAWTDPYVFASTKEVGMTVSRMLIGGGGIIAADVTLRELAQFLSQQKVSPSSVASIFTVSGEVLAHPDIERFQREVFADGTAHIRTITIDKVKDPLLQALYSRAAALQWPVGTSFRFEAAGVDYLASLQGMPSELGKDTVLAITAPVSELTRHVDAIAHMTLIASGILLVILIPVVVWVSRSMSRSLGVLAVQAEKLSSLEQVSNARVMSRVSEIQMLSEALHTSQMALNIFSRYVPKALVRKIVQSNQEPTLGGERRQLTLLFTDIAGFTTVCEETRPEQLIEMLSEYFSGVSTIVHAHGGTINKYIGDAVMAMWNVPERQSNHLNAACSAALAMKVYIEDFNVRMRTKGSPEFKTRMGIHTGTALVGHVGNADHIEYTALGDVVNIAARLEGLNKVYGTTILISEQVAQEVEKTLETRFVDQVIPKGRKNEVGIYELVGPLPIAKGQASEQQVRFTDS